MKEITYEEIEKSESIDLDKDFIFRNQFNEWVTPHYLKYLYFTSIFFKSPYIPGETRKESLER